MDQVTTEEFRWQDAHYNRDSRYGRELLFLIANSGWIRCTSETVDITRSDAVDTTIEIDVDLDQITHEAFHVGTPRSWLPLLVLPVGTRGDSAGQQPHGTQPRPGRSPESAPTTAPGTPGGRRWWRRRGPARPADESDPFANLTVTDATGDLLAMVPDVDVRHWISAALAEIVVNMAVARWVERPGRPRPEATRNQRLLLSAAIYRLLRSGPAEDSAAPRPDPASGQVPGTDGAAGPGPAAHPARGSRTGSGPISDAKTALDRLLDDYIYDSNQWQSRRGNVLAQRAVQVLDAFAQAAVVVVTVDRDRTPTVLTVRLPTRRLECDKQRNLGWPRARLQIDMIMPSADADRQIKINLPDGVRLDESRTAGPLADMVIEVNPPQPLKNLAVVMSQLLVPRTADLTALRPCIADLAAVKAEAAAETLRGYLVGSAPDLRQETDTARRKLGDLREELDRLSASPAAETGEALRELWGDGGWLRRPLRRRTSVDTLSPSAAVARAGMIEQVSHRAVPRSARMDVDVNVADAEIFSIARLAGVMSVLLMTVVLAFFAYAALRHKQRGDTPSPEVLAAALTLFSAIWVGRIDPADRSTLRGLLSAMGNWLIVASILPTIVLAVALAFNVSGWGPVWEASVAIAVQLALQGSIQLFKRHGLASAAGATRRRPRLRLSTTPAPDHSGYGVLQSDWWRSTTADALKVGRPAHAYVVWEHSEVDSEGPSGDHGQEHRSVPSLSGLLDDAKQAIPPSPSALTSARRLLGWLNRPHGAATALSPAETVGMETILGSSGQMLAVGADGADGADGGTPSGRPANILALLRSGTVAQALTFVVFREEPTEEWVRGRKAQRVDIDPDRLAPLESATDIIDIFVSVPRDCEPPVIECHPMVGVLAAAAKHHLIVLDAQLPVPSPSAGYTGCIWARVRVGLRDGEIRRLPAFLRAIRSRVAGHRVADHAECPPSDVLIRSVPERRLRVLVSARPAEPATEPRWVLASDLDVIAAAEARRGHRESARARSWRVLALCASARVGIEYDILKRLGQGRIAGQGMRLAGLTYAVLHGTAVILMLAHQPDKHGDSAPGLAADLRKHCADVRLAVLVDEWQSADDLGQAKHDLMLRVHIHAQDRPGTILDVVNSLNAALRAELRSLNDERGSVVWYVLTRVTVGQSTLLTARVPVEAKEIEGWTESKVHDIERSTRQGASSAAIARRTSSPLDDALGAPEDTVISVSFLKAPADPGAAEL